MKFLKAAVAFFLIAATAGAHAAESRRYAVLSLIGDKLLVAQYYPTEGFRTASGLEATVALDDNSLDKTALQSVDAAVKRIDPKSPPILLVAKDNTLYQAQERLMQTNQGSKPLLEQIAPMLRGSGATHLILLTKVRHEARVQVLKDTFVGSGKLEGLGFYVDAGRSTPAGKDGAVLGGTPMLGPFAYFKLELIDIARGEIVKEETVLASKAYGNPGSSNPWATLTNPQKIAALQDIIRAETARAVPLLLGQPRLR